MFALANLRSVSVSRCAPWEFKGVPPVDVHKDKDARTSWINNPKTEWQVYSLIEGLNENRRITAGAGDDDENPAYKIHGFVGDYDAPTKDEALLTVLQSCEYLPAHVERTLSGYLRLIWLFESPLLMPSAKFTKFFLQEILESFPIATLIPGFDRGAWVEPNRYYTNSGVWKSIEGAKPIPAQRLQGWLVKVSGKFNWVKDSEGTEIPFEDLRGVLATKYPRFGEWPGDFTLGEQGPTFWVDDSTSPLSAIVREKGIQTFSAHASKAFYTWADLLGSAFVKNYEVDSKARAVEGIYHDSKLYYRRLASGMWRGFDKTDIREFLKISRRINHKPNKQGRSNIDEAMEHIREHHAVASVGRFVFRPSGLLELDGQKHLNINTLEVLKPSGEPMTWGPGGNVPFLSTWLPAMFKGYEPALESLLDWLAVAYRSGYQQKPQSGQVGFLCGGVGVGKTLLNHVIGMVLGGSGQAEDYLLGKDAFGGELFGVPHWTIDDMVFAASGKSRLFSEMIKRMAANGKHRYHEKFKMPCQVEWLGRVLATLNPDPDSMRGMPECSESILDKIMLWRCVDSIDFKFPTKSELAEVLKRELPVFCRGLLDREIPPERQGDSRWGVKSFHDASLLDTAERSSYVSSFLEILNHWKHRYFAEIKAGYWEGNAFQLFDQISAVSPFGALRAYDAPSINRHLSVLLNRGHRIECDDSGSTRTWRVFRDDRPSNVTLSESLTTDKP